MLIAVAFTETEEFYLGILMAAQSKAPEKFSRHWENIGGVDTIDDSWSLAGDKGDGDMPTP